MTEDIRKEIEARAGGKWTAEIHGQESALPGSVDGAPGIDDRRIADLDRAPLGMSDDGGSFEGFTEGSSPSEQLEDSDYEN